ncbi:MAG: AMP-binding protein [Oligoflexia bacterium]|nr:AMP-binding protein [Oligoflexia bacterium]
MSMQNVALNFKYWAKKNPNKLAVIHPTKENESDNKITYGDLDIRSNQLREKFKKFEIGKGTKVLLFLRPSINFTVVMFALFKAGAVPVLIDPGMGRKNLLQAIREVAPDILIAEPEAHIARLIFRRPFNSIKYFITTKNKFAPMRARALAMIAHYLGGAYYLEQLLQNDHHNFEDHSHIEEMSENDLGAILFTSGGTGVPKGVEYTHKIFNTQIKMLRDVYGLNENDIDLPGFPFFALFTLNMGLTVCFPEMDPTKPAEVDPQKIIKNILDHKITFAAGSPAIWERVADYAVEKNIKLPTIKYLVMFGAPVKISIHQKFLKILTHSQANTFTPYGATESLPLTNVCGREVLSIGAEQTPKGKGMFVGRAVNDVEIKIIEIRNGVIENLKDVSELAVGEIGEIIVSGPIVTQNYYNKPDKTRLAKIKDSNSNSERIWHRMGDVGYLDISGNLWFCGRKDHVVYSNDGRANYTIPCEAIFNRHPQIRRTALIGIGGMGLAVERIDGRVKMKKSEQLLFERELKELGEEFEITKDIKRFYYFKKFPVDIRHNIKIDRQKLAKLANHSSYS